MKNFLKKVLRIFSPLYRKTDDMLVDLHSLREELFYFESQTKRREECILDTIEIYNELPLILKKWEDLKNGSDRVYDKKDLPLLLFRYAYRYQANITNIGDNVQTLAAWNALKNVFDEDISSRIRYIDRDELSCYSGEPALCVMQGWFSRSNAFWPSPRIIPVFAATHFNSHAQRFIRKLFTFAPEMRQAYEIGCRDLATLNFCRSLGMKAYFSRCFTLTLPKRQKTPAQKKVFLVDVPDEFLPYIPADIRKDAVRIWQRTYPFDADIYEQDPMIYQKIAKELYARYENEATLLVTTAIHCAMPATAMGIPVVFIAPDADSKLRSSALINILPQYSFDDLKNGEIDFSPVPPDIEPLKQLMYKNLKLSIAASSGETIDRGELELIRQKIAEYCCISDPVKINAGTKEIDIDRMMLDFDTQHILNEKVY